VEHAVKAAIFDFDGPIFPGRTAACAALDATYDRFAASVGRPRQSMAAAPLFAPKQMIAAAYAEFDLSHDRLDEIREYYSEQLTLTERELVVAPDMITLLDELLARGRKLAILSGRRTANVTDLLKRLGLFGRFAAVFGSDGVSTNKLDAAAVPTIARCLGLEPSDLVLVGDSDIDYLAAQRAGIAYYHVAWSGEPTSEAHVRASAVAFSVADLSAILSNDEPLGPYAGGTLPASLLYAIRSREFSFFAGAGVSVPSGVGGWAEHYLPLLRNFGAGPLVRDLTLPETVQLLSTDPAIASSLFDRFRDSFRLPNKRANAYHYALLKSRARTVWTTNYDQLFERAIGAGGFEHTVVKTDADLLKNFGAKSLIIKMNGDFEGAQYRPDLDWDMVFLEEQFDTAELKRREIWRLFEDDYRNKLIIFIGISFKDPALRRILSVAAKAIPRSRHWHLLLMKEPDEPLERTKHRLYSETLKRRYIQTLFFHDFAAIERFVCRIAAQANRPIVGFSGTSQALNDSPLTGAFLYHEQVVQFCARSGRALAAQNFRVTSGHGEGVGIPAVVAAFEHNPTSARFYLRRRGTTAFSRTAPAIVVSGDTLEAMRQRFVSELDLLIAIGGRKFDTEQTSGMIEEIKLAIHQHVPVLIVPQAGGDAARFAAELEALMR
jgi:phosphoglycolate phosphatase